MDFVALLPDFGNVLFTLGAFIVALSIIVAIHEYGHYIVGRWSGIHAEVFSLGFGPVLFSRVDKRGTKWQVAALPFGGYVRFLGDSDAASGKDGETISNLSDTEQRRTMHGAPLWARAATVAAGPVFNFILSILILTGLALSTGVATTPPTIGEIYPLPVEGITLKSGDMIEEIEGTAYPSGEGFAAFSDGLPVKPLLEYTVQRDGVSHPARGPVLFPTRVAAMTPGSAAEESGMKEGDVILSLNGQTVTAFHEMIDIVNGSDGAPVVAEIWRDGEVSKLSVVPKRRDLPTADGFETRWLMGVSASYFFTPQVETPGVFQAVEIGATRTYDTVKLSLSGLYHMIVGQISSCNISGPIGIAKVSGAMASKGTASFIVFIAMLSTAVGLMNLFPIPILDGGHLVFHAWEAVTGKPPSDGALRVLMFLGLALLLSLMVFAVGNDLFCK